MNDKEIKKFLESIGFSEDPDIDGEHAQKGSYQMTLAHKICIRIGHNDYIENSTKEQMLSVVAYKFYKEINFITKLLKGIIEIESEKVKNNN